MPATLTRYVEWRRLRDGGESAVIVVKLMMASTDLSLANEAVGEWKKDQPSLKSSRRKSAGMYFVRLQLAHLHEGLKLIRKINGDESLKKLMEQCDTRTQECFAELMKLAEGGPRHDEFERLVGRVRHNVTFHYDENGKLIGEALTQKGILADGKGATVTRGSSMELWRFKVADDILDDIVVHGIWGISRESNVPAEADNVAGTVHNMVVSFIDFSGEFIWKYCGG